MTTMLETLNETAAAYTSKTRAVNAVNGGCQYFTDGRCCAVGRCMKDPEKFKDFHGNANRFHAIDLLLKPGYHGFSIDFWLDLQDLHDWEENWSETGLTERGKETVARIKKAHDL